MGDFKFIRPYLPAEHIQYEHDARRAVNKQCEFQIRKEGFIKNLTLAEFWSNDVVDGTTKPGLIYDKAVKDMYPQFFVPPSRCYIVPKAYNQSQEHLQLFGIAGKLILGSMKRILYDSGIRQFWVSIKLDFDRWQVEKLGRVVKSESVHILGLDKRLKSLFCLTIGLLSVPLVMFVFFESRNISVEVI